MKLNNDLYSQMNAAMNLYRHPLFPLFRNKYSKYFSFYFNYRRRE